MPRLAYASLLAALSAPLFAACETSGDRAVTGSCPAGEVCSSKTPKGLHFRGPDFADDWIADPSLKRTAVGGAQTISIVNAEDEQNLAFPYAASLSTGNLAADPPAGALLTLHGQGSGDAMLRITDATDGKLFDRVDVNASQIATTDVVAFHQEALLAADPAPAIMLGSEVQLLARLTDASLHRLVDQSLAITVTGQSAQPRTWDTVAVTPNAVGTIGVQLTAGGQARASGSITVVDAIDRVVPGWTSFDQTSPPLAKQSLVACIEARRGAQPVVGLTWQLTATGADTTSTWFAVNCLTFTRATPGAVTIHGTAGGQSADFVIDVGAAALTRYASPPDLTPGEYARSFD